MDIKKLKKQTNKQTKKPENRGGLGVEGVGP